MVQWLRLYASTAGARIGSLIGEVLHASGYSQKKNNTVVFFIHTVKNQNLWSDSNGTPLQYPCLENPMDGGAC